MSCNRHNLLHTVFTDISKKYSQKCAVILNGKEYTYSFINRVANYYSDILTKKCNICIGDHVVIYDDFTIESIISILAVLKAGAAYIPINPEHPEKRNIEIIEESNAKVIMSSKAVKPLNIAINSYIILDTNNQKEDIEENIIDDDSVAYVIYTSGSTGIPKGVSTSHRNIVSHIEAFNERMQIDNRDKFLGLYSMNVDASVEQLFSIITVGGTFVLCNREERNDILKIEEIVRKEHCTILGAPPVLLKLFNQKARLKNTSLRLILTGGDVLRQEYISKLLPEYTIMNGYGVTEASISSLWHQVKENEKEIPIGKPLNNVLIYIVDEKGNAIKDSEIGEIVIAGESVSEYGYINNKTENIKKFRTLFGERCYFTGDLGRYDENRNILFCGRKDAQIEIDGHRIEPREIEVNLCKNKMIKDAFVCKDKNMLKAYIVAEEFDLNNLKMYMENLLPQYMLPNEYYLVDYIPRNDMGKVKEYELKIKKRQPDETDISQLQSKLQRKIADLWKKVLNKDIEVGLKTNFYSVGGSSILLMELLYEIKEEFNINLTMQDLLSNLEIQQMEKLIIESKNNRKKYTKTNQNKYLLTDIQKSIYFMDKVSCNGMYNNVGVYWLQGTYNLAQIVSNIKHVFSDVRIFKIRISNNDFSECTYTSDAKAVFLEIKDFSNKSWIEQIKLYDQILDREIRYIFNLQEEPPARFIVIKIAEEQSIIIGNIHHMVIDGISWNILFDNIFNRLESSKYNKEEFDYLDYANEKVAYSSKEKDFWYNEIYSVDQSNYRIYDYKNPVLNFEGQNIDLNIDAKVLQKIEKTSERLEVSVNTIFIVVVYLVLYKYTHSETIITGVTYAGRNEAALQKIIGPFINMLPIKITIKENEKIDDLIIYTKDKLNSCFANGNYPFEKMVTDTNSNLETNQSPIFQWAIDFIEEDILTTKSFQVIPVSINTKYSKYEINMLIYNMKGNYRIKFEYCTGYFSRKFMSELIRNYNSILESICDAVTVKELFNNITDINAVNISNSCIEDKQILEVISKYTTKNNILDSDSYATLGISSLKLVEIAVDLEEKLNKKIRVLDLFGLRDIGELISFLKGKAAGTKQIESRNIQKNYNKLSRVKTRKKTRNQLIDLVASGENDNLLLLFPSMNGRTQEYSKDIFKDLIGGIKSNSILTVNYNNRLAKNFEGLCQEIVLNIEWNRYRKIILLGWCNGGYLAYKVAELIKEKYPEKLEVVMLLDCYHPLYIKEHPYLDNSKQEYAQLIQSFLKTMFPEDKSIVDEHFIRKITSLSRRETEEFVMSKLSNSFDQKSAKNLMNKYILLYENAAKESEDFFANIDIRKNDISLFIATSSSEEITNILGWDKSQVKKVILTGGNHLTMLSVPYVNRIIELINCILDGGNNNND